MTSPETRQVIGDNVRAVLKSFIERVEKLEEEKKAISDDIRDVFAEAKGNGFDVKAMKRVIAIRKMDPNDCAELNAIIDMYCKALGLDVFG